MRGRRNGAALPAFSFGAAREAYHARWPSDLHDAVMSATDGLPRMLKQVFHKRLVQEIDGRLDAGETVAPADVAAIFGKMHSASRWALPAG